MKHRNLTKTLTVELKRVPQSAIQGNAALAESFGLDLQQLNDPTYFIPTEDDYVLVPVRMLSATSVQSDMFNFGHNEGKALKEATAKGMFDGLVILKDHNMRVDNWLGKTQGTFWDETTPGAPMGVTGMMKLDKKSDPKAIRGILSGMLDSVSVTIQFDYEPSHPKMSEMDFYMKLGQMVDGKMVQALVTNITRVYELSVVWTGADQYAKVPGDDGSIHVPGVSHSHSFKEGLMDPKKLAALLGLDPETATAESLEAFLKQFAGIETTLKAAQGQVTQLTADLATAKTQVETLTADLATANSKTAELQAEVDTLKPQAELGVAHLAAQKAEAQRIYTLAVGDKKEESILKLMEEATDLATLQGFIKTFSEQADKIAPLTCQKCGCQDVQRRASKDEGHKGSDHTAVANSFELKRLEKTVAGMHR